MASNAKVIPIGKDLQRARALAFRKMHEGPGILVLPNAWDCVSARLFERAGFPALATTSGGIAALFGYPDGQKISAQEMLGMVGRMAATVSVPVTADLEAGYGDAVPEVVDVMRRAVTLGLAGANLEDGRGHGQPLAEVARQVEVIRAIREAVSAAGTAFVLNARVDVFLHGAGGEADRFREAVRRARAYLDAGADCVFPIGLRDREAIARFARETPGPVNIMAGHGAPGVAELEQLGVRRASFGTAPARAILGSVQRLARELRATGASPLLEQTEFTHAAVNALFSFENPR